MAHWSTRHARSILFLLVALVAGGVLGTVALPVALFPHVNFPRIRVNIDAGDRPAEQMELEVTRPLEIAFRSVPGVRKVESTTSRGTAEVWLTFDWGEDMTAAYLRAEAEVSRAMPALPHGTTFDIRRMDPTVFPVIAYSLTSDKRPLTELQDLALHELVPVLSEVKGVAKVDVEGGDIAELHVTVDPAQLAAHGLTIDDLSTAMASANIVSATGRAEDRGKLYLVIADGRFQSIDALRAMPVKAGSDGVVRLGDIAAVTSGVAPNYTRAVADGHDCVLLNIYQQPGGNTVAIAAAVRATLAREQRRIPSGVTLTNWYDQSDLISSSATGVRDAVIIGVALAALVLLLFLRNWRMTLIATIAVPVVLAITAGVLYVLGESFNIMTLGGMAAAVGLIIDDAIVMSEHIVRRLHDRTPGNELSAAIGARVEAAADEFTNPLVGSSLSTIVIHIPPAFLVGVFGAFFAALSLSMATSLIVSFAVTWLVIPVLASRVLRGVQPHAKEGRLARSAGGAYAKLMNAILAQPWLVILIALPLLAGGYYSYKQMQTGLMPQLDEGGFIIDYVGPPGASLKEMNRLMDQVDSLVGAMPEVQTYTRRTGFAIGGDFAEPHTGDYFVRLKPLPRRSMSEVMADLHDRIAAKVPVVDLELAGLMGDVIGDITGRPEPVVIDLFADDPLKLNPAAQRVAKALAGISGVDEIVDGITPAGDAFNVRVDPVRAALEGLDADAVSKQLSSLLSGDVATNIAQGERTVNVRVWTTTENRRRPDQLGQLLLRSPDGHLVPLSRIAAFETLPGQPEITRQDLQRMVAVTARSSRDLGSTIRDVQAMLARPGLLPPGMRFVLGGQYAEQQAAFRGTIGVVVAAGALVFLLLIFLYESLRVAIAIFITTGLAIALVFAGLALTGTELNISSMMGMVMIVGNVTEVAIFYYSEYTSLPPDVSGRSRLIAAGSHRTRAIVMTTLAAILALLPLALDLGHSAGMLRPLAVAIIAGLAVQLPLVLIVLPALLVLFRVNTESKSFTQGSS